MSQGSRSVPEGGNLLESCSRSSGYRCAHSSEKLSHVELTMDASSARPNNPASQLRDPNDLLKTRSTATWKECAFTAVSDSPPSLIAEQWGAAHAQPVPHRLIAASTMSPKPLNENPLPFLPFSTNATPLTTISSYSTSLIPWISKTKSPPSNLANTHSRFLRFLNTPLVSLSISQHHVSPIPWAKDGSKHHRSSKSSLVIFVVRSLISSSIAEVEIERNLM